MAKESLGGILVKTEEAVADNLPAVVPDTPMAQFQEAQAVTWRLMRFLDEMLRFGEVSEKWRVAKLFPPIQAQLNLQLTMLKDLMAESDEIQEAKALRQALLDLMASESPAFRARIMARMQDLLDLDEEEPESLAPKRKRGRPRKKID